MNPATNPRPTLAAEGATFQVPPDFDDLTDYAFRNAPLGERLSVHHAPAAAGVAPLGATVAEYLTRQIRLFAREGITVEWVGPAPAPGREAQRLQFLFADHGRTYRQQVVLARLAGGEGLVVTYVTRAADTGVVARFDQVLQSIRPAGDGDGSPGPGLVRRQAGAVTLAVPDGLRPPETYQLVSKDAQLRLNVQVGPAGGPPPASVRTEAEAGPGLRGARVGTYGGWDMYERRRPGAAGPVADYVCQGRKTLPNGVEVYLSGQCVAEAAGRMQQAMAQLADSIQERR
jgi:hypothetical protein